MTDHVSAKALAYLEGRLPGSEQARVAAHLAACAACRAEVEDFSHLAEVLAAVPRALAEGGFAQRRSRLWPSIWSRVAPGTGATPVRAQAGRAPARLHSRAAWPKVALAMCALAVTGMLASPFQRGALAAAADPPLAVIQTPAAPHSSLTSAPAGESVFPAADSTATLALHQGQTPAPIPNP